jgi:hypothetical protein
MARTSRKGISHPRFITTTPGRQVLQPGINYTQFLFYALIADKVGVNKKSYSHQKYGVCVTESSQPKGVKKKTRERKAVVYIDKGVQQRLGVL